MKFGHLEEKNNPTYGTYDHHGLLTGTKWDDPPSISPALRAPGLDNTVLQVNDCQTQTPNGVPLLKIFVREDSGRFFLVEVGKAGTCS